MNLKSRIKAKALQLGFELCNITDARPLDGYERYEQWLRQGLHAEMHFLESQRARRSRADLHSLFEPIRSVVVLGPLRPLPYGFNPPLHYPWGRISAYTLGEDYHLSLPPKIHELAAWIQSEVGDAFPYKVYTDAGPILERELAMRSGLGWIGKNGCLINPRLGSSLLLAELLLPIELEPDNPLLADYCGSCNRCIQACPTSCILANRTIDASRCIAYLTIEHRGAIAPDLRPKLGKWVFGCDICQMVCPWNHRASRRLPQFQSMDFSALFPNLLEEIHLTPNTFKAKYGRSAVSRAKWRNYLRNVIIVAGNLLARGSANASIQHSIVNALSNLLVKHADPLIRANAAWSLGKRKSEETLHYLKTTLSSEQDPYVISEITAALNLPNHTPE